MQEMQEMWVQSLGREDPLEKGMAAHSSILAWRIPWTDHGVAKSRTPLRESDTHRNGRQTPSIIKMDFSKYSHSWSKRYDSVPWNTCEAGISTLCHGCGSLSAGSVPGAAGISGHHLCAAPSPPGPQSSEFSDLDCSTGTWRCHSMWWLVFSLSAIHFLCGQRSVLFLQSSFLTSAEGGCGLHLVMEKKVLAREMRLLGAPGSYVWTCLLLVCGCKLKSICVWTNMEEAQFHPISRHCTPITITLVKNQHFSFF